ncbi:MAG TPA: DUF6770 family protein [Puia sp.]|nr:DUF6770 family protein [Puia sp.]
MNKISLRVLLATGFMIIANLSYSQKLTIDKVYTAYLRNSGPILQKEEIKGYYLFYQSDKVDRHTDEYTVQILDENLNKVKDIKFTDDKSIQLLESSFNGSCLIFLFYNKGEKQLNYRIYDMDGKKKYEYSKEIDKKTKSMIDNYEKFKSEDGLNKEIFDIEDRGFISVIPEREGKIYSYEINILHSDQKKQIVYTPNEDIKFATANYLGSNDTLAFFEILKKERLTSNTAESWLLGINLFTGKKAFEISTEKEEYKFYPMNVSTLQGSSDYMMLGSYYDKSDRVLADNTLGLAIWVMDNKGKIKIKKYNSWTKEIGKYLNVNEKGKIDNIGYLFFHRILQTEDGKIFAVGEGYKRTASALGITMTAIGALAGHVGSSGVTKLVITDMVMMQFDNVFNIEDAKIYEKNHNNFESPNGMGGDFMSPHLMAQVVKAYGGFDFAFTQTDQNHSNFVVAYTDYEKSKEYKGLTFHSISYFNNKFTTDKINLSSKASKTKILPGKPGSVMVLEYFKKEKKLDMRLEKIN